MIKNYKSGDIEYRLDLGKHGSYGHKTLVGVGIFIAAVGLWCGVNYFLGKPVPKKPVIGNAVVGKNVTVAKASGHPVIVYRLMNSTVKAPYLNTHGVWKYAIIKKLPTDQELIDLALELHTKYPATKFHIVDSASGIQLYDAFLDHPLELRLPREFADHHVFAMVNRFREDGRWKLCADTAHPHNGEFIAVLE